jgi:hypothetical protein
MTGRPLLPRQRLAKFLDGWLQGWSSASSHSFYGHYDDMDSVLTEQDRYENSL